MHVAVNMITLPFLNLRLNSKVDTLNLSLKVGDDFTTLPGSLINFAVTEYLLNMANPESGDKD
jgi:hypothetical protein